MGRRGAIAVRARARRSPTPSPTSTPCCPPWRPRSRPGATPAPRRGPPCAPRSSCGSTRVARDRPRGDAHDGPGVPDGVPGGRVARAGPRARGGRVRAGGDAPRPGGRDLGEAAGQAAAAADGSSASGSCRAGSRCSSAARRSRPGTATRDCSRASRPATRCWSSRSRRAVLPLAITVAVAREVLAEAGFSPDLVALTVDAPGDRSAADLALRPEVRLIDFTGSTAFGTWLESHATQAVVFAEKSGVNARRHRRHRRLPGHAAATSRSRCRCTAARCARRRRTCSCPTAASTPTRGIGRSTRSRRTWRRRSTGCSGDPKRAAAVLGGIVGPDVLARVAEAEPRGRRGARVARRSSTPSSPMPSRGRRSSSPCRRRAERLRPRVLRAGRPTSSATGGTDESLEIWGRTTREHGALTAGAVRDRPGRHRAGARPSPSTAACRCRSTSPAASTSTSRRRSPTTTRRAPTPRRSASFTDEAFVAPRFHVTQWRRHLPDDPAPAGSARPRGGRRHGPDAGRARGARPRPVPLVRVDRPAAGRRGRSTGVALVTLDRPRRSTR